MPVLSLYNFLCYIKVCNLSILQVYTNFNPFLVCGHAHLYYLDESISSFRGFMVNVFTFIVICIEVKKKKTVASDQTSAVFAMGLTCKHMSPKWVSNLNGVNTIILSRLL